MREHQIVITLKPEQFLQVQKLARNAGAKSMGLFVRQQLLIALGIEGSIAAGTATGQQSKSESSDMDLEPIKSELKRLHSQLREFVAEAIMNYSEFDLENSETAVSVEIQSGLPFTAENPNLVQVVGDLPSDEMEKTAQATFAISPRLGAFDASAKFKTAGADNSFDPPARTQEPASYQSESAPAEPASSYQSSRPDPFAYLKANARAAASKQSESSKPADYESPRPEPTSYGSSSPEFESYNKSSIPEASPESSSSEPESYQSAISNSASYEDPSSEPESNQRIAELAGTSEQQQMSPAESYLSQPLPPGVISRSVQDDLGNAADSVTSQADAPAPVPSFFQQKPASKTPWVFGSSGSDSSQSYSSPNMKSLLSGIVNESGTDDRRDPLSELLDPGDMQTPAAGAASGSMIDDDDSFDVPLSILTRRRQLAAMAESIEGSTSKDKDDVSTKPASSVPPRKPNKPDLSDSKVSHDNLPRNEEEKPKSAEAQSVSGTYQAYVPLGNPDEDSPFSGGPPPKKRQ